MMKEREGIPLPDIDPVAFELFINLIISDTWEADHLESLYLEHNTVLTLLGFCRRYEILKAIENLEDAAMEFIRSCPIYKDSEEFLGLSQENLETVFSCKKLPFEEIDIFECACRWAEHQCEQKNTEPTGENFREILGSSLFEIRFPTMKLEDFTKVSRFEKNLFSLEEKALCRHCKEKETLAHVLGKCHVGSLLRTSRHHEVRTIIANHLRTLGWVVHEEVTDGASKRVDIICWRKDLKAGYILDPTIRMEQSSSQAEEVNIEKQAHYNPCIPYFLDKYQLKKFEVVGLLVGARGTITGFFESFRKDLRLPSKMIEEIVVATIRGSCRIAHNHLYNMNLTHS